MLIVSYDVVCFTSFNVKYILKPEIRSPFNAIYLLLSNPCYLENNINNDDEIGT